MTSAGTILQAVGVVWPVSEVILAAVTRAKHRGAHVQDRGSLALLWAAIGLGIWGGLALRRVPVARIPIPSLGLAVVALALLAVGLALRWTAILTLGRLFSAEVAIQRDHRVVKTGPYRRIRHPAYTGLLVAFLGLAFAYGTWLGLLVMMVPITSAILYRIRVEEAWLVKAFGQEYVEYCATTKRLVPGLV
jgi:protein-S-isoprenylcysteine O-methyltransferase